MGRKYPVGKERKTRARLRKNGFGEDLALTAMPKQYPTRRRISPDTA
jgi:hypothetical protein